MDLNMLRKVKYFVKHAIYFLFFYSGLLHLFIILVKKIRKNHCAIILFYHRFGENEKKKILPYIEIKEFEKQIAHVKHLYKIISMDDITSILKSGQYFIEPSVAITIDDGYRDNYALAFPAIRKHRIPVIIYLTSGFVGTNSGLWVDDIEYILLNTTVKTLRFRALFGNDVLDISSLQDRKKTLKKLFGAMLQMSNSQREKYLNILAEILTIDIPSMNGRERIMLNWEEIREMSNNGVEFGAHTVTHPFLPVMPLEDGKNEIKRSKDIIGEKIGKSIKHFAVPNGTKKDFTPALKDYCAETGFDTIVMTESGVVSSDADRYALKRIIPPPPLYYFACEIARYFFSQMEKI
jgi:peptidoglycan/xylan/chitin deacetylase (PgdA/CDA1 family)